MEDKTTIYLIIACIISLVSIVIILLLIVRILKKQKTDTQEKPQFTGISGVVLSGDGSHISGMTINNGGAIKDAEISGINAGIRDGVIGNIPDNTKKSIWKEILGIILALASFLASVIKIVEYLSK